MSIINMFRKRPYYYIPPCPICKSYRTGRYIKTHRSGDAYIEEASLRNGEIVRFIPKEPIKNAFCVDCGYEWPCSAKIQFMTPEEIEKEQERRTTREAYMELKALLNDEKKQKRKKPGKRILSIFTG